ncbi:MAG: hypothetical protein J0H04_11525, partial [Hyphomicrobium denitrificans]|nr:hypothetical protein [Hyphomicrobium denitrificans]
MAIRDQFPSRGALSSARQFFAITPHADNDLPEVPRGVWVGGAGNINMIGAPGSDAVVLKGVP